ncbi:MAG: hypothetical protein MJ151_03585 [Lachnospiraceae bacterium]|nr:hypothetical protein [Lachnospiraceae bacterium]
MIDDNDVKDMLARRYLDRLIECIVNLQNVNCTLDRNEKTKEVEKYIDNKYVDECLKDAKPKKKYLSVMYKVLASKNTNLILLMAKFISTVKKKDVRVFSLLKKNR